MSVKIIKNKLGFSLIEVIVALGVFSMLVATIASTSGLTYIAEKQGGERTVAQAYAVEAMEAVKSIRARGWSELIVGQHGLNKDNGYWQFSGTDNVLGIFTRHIMIEQVYRDGEGNIVTSGGIVDNHTLKVIVLVTWTFGVDADNEYTLTNYLTNWSSKDWQQTDWSGGPDQVSWLNESEFFVADEAVDIQTVGEIKLKEAGTQASPYALLMHFDGPRFKDSGVVDNSDFENYEGLPDNIDWSDWSEIKFGSETNTTPGYNGGLGARVDLAWPLAIGALQQYSIPVEPSTTYQLSFYVKGDVDYVNFFLRDENYYYLKSNGTFSWWFTDVPVSNIGVTDEWVQYSISFTTRSSADYLYLTFSGWAFDFNQYYALDKVILANEIVYDETGYKNNGIKKPSDNSGPEYVVGNFSQGLEFDESYVRIPASDSLNITGNITLESWIYPTETGGGNYFPIITKWAWTGGDFRSYRLTINPNKKLQFFISQDGLSGNGHEYSVSSSSQIEKNQWQHVVGMYDGSSLKVYINGEPEGSVNYNQGIFNSGANADVLIGAIDNNHDDDYTFVGKMDETSVEMRALSETEVYEHYLNSPLTPEDVIVWTAPTPKGFFITDKKVAGMHVNGDWLYVALLDKKKVEIFDLSVDPENPPSIGDFGTVHHSEDVFSYGNFIYVMTDVASPGIEIYYYDDNPINAVQVGSIAVGNGPTGIWIDQNYLYISLSNHNVNVYDLSTSPVEPEYLGDFTSIQNTSDITIYEDYAYVSLNNAAQAVETFDISTDPTNPTSTNILSMIEEPAGIIARDNYLFTVTQGAVNKVLVFNIGDNPGTPSALGDFSISDNGKDLATRGTYLYVGLAGSSKGIEVFDMTFLSAGGAGDTNYEVYGSLESSVFDTGSASGFNFISWDEILPEAEDDVKVQIKTASSIANLNSAAWQGPGGIGTYYESPNETMIPATNNHNSHRYIKYLIHLFGTGDTSPIINNIKINYTP